MQRRFVKNLALLLFLNLLIKPFWILGIDRTVQNQVGDVNYGFFLSMYSFSIIFFILLDLGITNYNNRNIAQNNHLLAKHFAGIATMKLVLGILYSIVVFIVGFSIGYRGEQLNLLAWLVFNQFLLSFILYLRSNISGLLLFKTDSMLSVLDRLLMIFICSLLLWSGFFITPIKISWYVYAQTTSYFLTTLVALIIVLSHTGKIKLSFNWPFSLMIIKKSMPFALLVLLMSIYNRMEPVLLERLLPGETGLHQSGVYGRAFRLLDAGNNISLLFAVLLLPLFSTMIKHKNPINDLVKLSFTIILAISLTTAISSITFSNKILELMYPQTGTESANDFIIRIHESALVFRILMGSFVAVSSTYIFGTLLTANGNLKLLNISAAFGVVLNIGLNFILIPHYQSFGASIASFSVQLLTAVAQFIFAFKVIDLTFGRNFWIRLSFFILLLITANFFVQYLPIKWPFQLVIGLLSSVILLFILKLLDIKGMHKMTLEIIESIRK